MFWFTVMNIAQAFGYIPIRGFTSGDVRNFLLGFSGSPWLTFIPGTLFALWGIWVVFAKQVPKFYRFMLIQNLWVKRVFLLILVLVVFGFYGVLISLIKQQTLMLVFSVLAAIATYAMCFKQR